MSKNCDDMSIRFDTVVVVVVLVIVVVVVVVEIFVYGAVKQQSLMCRSLSLNSSSFLNWPTVVSA